jgi:large subunit ribosomal protein L25
MSEQSTALLVTRREPGGSRSARRLRREGNVPGTVYGGGQEPVSFQIDARTLRNTLAASSAVIDLQIDGETAQPVVLKDRTRHPVSGDTVHVDFLRVDLNKPIQTPVPLELTGVEESDVKTGGVLEHTVREVTLEAVPTKIPEALTLDITGLEMGNTKTLGDVEAPEGTTIIGDLEQVVVSIHTPRAVAAETTEGEEIETETEVVGEESEGGDDSADGDSE